MEEDGTNLLKTDMDKNSTETKKPNPHTFGRGESAYHLRGCGSCSGSVESGWCGQEKPAMQWHAGGMFRWKSAAADGCSVSHSICWQNVRAVWWMTVLVDSIRLIEVGR